jgi:hypothetical protein
LLKWRHDPQRPAATFPRAPSTIAWRVPLIYRARWVQ